jgi:cation:H+ antiporter
MEQLHDLLSRLNTPLILLVMTGTIAVLGKSADWLVGTAVALSERSGLPKAVIGATVVSLGTTTPEAATSVLAAIQGNPGLALGNAVGSVICDTGLILGLCSLIGPLPLQGKTLALQGRVQLGAGILLVLVAFPWTMPQSIFQQGGHLSQPMGIIFLVLLLIYLHRSVLWARQLGKSDLPMEESGRVGASLPLIALKLGGAVLLVVGSSHILISTATTTAQRWGIPQSIIAATLVAFGTSLPELVTAITAVRKRHGELALGNIIGADILNVLFVAGAAASVTSGGLRVEPVFFTLLFPSMIAILVTFRTGVFFSQDQFKRPFGLMLLSLYALATALSYFYGA